MLQIQQIKENKAFTIEGLNRKYFKGGEEAVEQILGLDEKRRETQVELDNTLAKSNALAKEIGGLMKSGKKDEAETAKAETGTLKVRAKELEEVLKSTESELYEVLVTCQIFRIQAFPQEKHLKIMKLFWNMVQFQPFQKVQFRIGI